MTTRRDFIFKGILAAIGAQIISARKSAAWVVEAILAMVILMIGALVIFKLLGLCRKLNNPRKPDKDDGASAPPNSPAISQVKMSLDKMIDESYFGTIDDKTDDFKTASGTFYTGMMSALIESSTDLKTWVAAGSFTAWFADDSARVTQVNAAGVKSVTTIQNWKSTGIPAFIAGSGSNQRFFRTAPNL